MKTKTKYVLLPGLFFTARQIVADETGTHHFGRKEQNLNQTIRPAGSDQAWFTSFIRKEETCQACIYLSRFARKKGELRFLRSRKETNLGRVPPETASGALRPGTRPSLNHGLLATSRCLSVFELNQPPRVCVGLSK